MKNLKHKFLIILFASISFAQDINKIKWDSLALNLDYKIDDGLIIYEEIYKKSFFSKPVTFNISGTVFFRLLSTKTIKNATWYEVELFDGKNVYNQGWIEAKSLMDKNLNQLEEEKEVFTIGKSTVDQKLIDKYGYSVANVISKRLIVIGMTREMVIRSLGYPNEENKQTTAGTGTFTQMIYDTGIYSFVYLDNGKVVSFIERKFR